MSLFGAGLCTVLCVGGVCTWCVYMVCVGGACM